MVTSRKVLFLIGLSVSFVLSFRFDVGFLNSPIFAQDNQTDSKENPGQGTTIRSAYGTLEELFQAEIINIGLEQLGYEVIPPAEVEYDITHTAIARGYLDYTASHWKPLHNNYYEANSGGETMERVGTLIEDARQGYLIDQETAQEYNITEISQLQDPELATLFDHNGDGKANLTGCNPGWGCAAMIDHHLNAYGLRDTVEHDQGNYFALIEETFSSFEQNEPILYYTWTPLWVSNELQPEQDVTWLEVPYTDLPRDRAENTDTKVDGKNLGFPVNQIGVLANQQFLANNPAAERFFEVAEIPIEDVSAQNSLMRNGENNPTQIRQHAEEWIQSNQEEFQNWLEQARQAVE